MKIMYKNFIFKKILIALAIIFTSIGVLWVLWFLSLNENNEIFVFTFYGGLYIFVWYYVFFIYILKIRIHPKKNITPVTLDEIKNKIQNYFWQGSQDNEPIFKLEELRNGLKISWNRTIDFKQILDYWSKNINYKTCLFFDEKRSICNIHSQITHISKSAGISAILYSMNFTSGLVYETGADYRPSFEVKDSKIDMNIKKLSYNNASIIDPIIEICILNGWIANFLIFKHRITRMIYTFSGWIVLSVSVILISFGLLWVILGVE